MTRSRKLIPALALALAGCTFVEVANVSDFDTRVVVHVPDSSAGYTRTVNSGEVAAVFSSQGGRHAVSVLSFEEYQALVIDVRHHITRRLFNERVTLTADEVHNLIQKNGQPAKPP